MRWQRQRRSRYLDDRRAQRTPRRGVRGGLGLGGLVAVLALSWLLGINPLPLLTGGIGPTSGGGGFESASTGADMTFQSTAAEEELVDFISFVLDDLQQTWSDLVPGYRPSTLVLFREATRSGCGLGQAEMGPFYCPRDQKVYVDLTFYGELRERFGAPGDFAQQGRIVSTAQRPRPCSTARVLRMPSTTSPATSIVTNTHGGCPAHGRSPRSSPTGCTSVDGRTSSSSTSGASCAIVSGSGGGSEPWFY